MAFSAPAFAVGAALAAGAILKFEAGNVLQDGPSALLNPNPGGAVPSVAQAIARQACRRYADGVPGLDEGAAVNYETVCRPYLDNIGYGVGPKVELPFRGGQCECEIYSYEVTWTQVRPGSPNQDFLSRHRSRGPISSITAVRTSASNTRLTIIARGTVDITGTNVAAPPCSPQSTTFTKNYTTGATDTVIQGFAVTYIGTNGGGPCGNVPPEVIPPEPPPTPGPRREPFVVIPIVDVDIEVELFPDGTLEVNLGTGDIQIGPFEIGGGGGGGDGGLAPGDVGEPFPFPAETGPGGDVLSEAPPGSVLVGLQINVLASPPFARQYEPGIFRGACYIYMGAGALLDQDFGGSMLQNGQFFFAEKDNLTVWRVRATTGFNLRVTPYYREVSQESP